MEKSLIVVQVTRRGHLCAGCQGKIPGRHAAIALVTKERINGKEEKFVAYFHNIDCYNGYEFRNIYGAGAACDVGPASCSCDNRGSRW